jgi:hypothetical protein
LYGDTNICPEIFSIKASFRLLVQFDISAAASAWSGVLPIKVMTHFSGHHCLHDPKKYLFYLLKRFRLIHNDFLFNRRGAG